MDSPKQAQICVNGRTVDLLRGSVTDGSGLVLTLRPQAAQVLGLLAAQPGVPVTRDELMEAVWPGIAVTDDSLVQCIKEVRKAIGDESHELIVTLVKRGYVFEERALRHPQPTNAEAAVLATASTPRADPAERSHSIAVLPFTNLSADPEQEFFVDGLTEDLITELSKVPDLFVIARYTSFAFKGKSGDVHRVAEELGVRYILLGSARRSAGRIRVNAQLIDAREGGGNLWAERFDRDLADIFAVQDEVVTCIVEALVGKLAASNLLDRRAPRNVEAYDLCVRGRFLWRRTMPDDGREARRLFEQAIAVDPNYAEAHAHLAWTHWMGWVNWFEPEEPHRRLALEIARRAVSLDPNDAWAHTTLGHVLAYEHEYEESAAHLAIALKLGPNHADMHLTRADLLVMEGRLLEAVASVARAFRLNPQPPAFYYWVKGEAEYAAGQYERAVETLRLDATYGTPSRSILAAALAQLGRMEEAQTEGRLFMAEYPDFRIESFLDTQPFRRPADREHFADGYRKAALPEK